MEIGKDLIAKLGLLFEINNRVLDTEEWGEEDLLITRNVIRGYKHGKGWNSRPAGPPDRRHTPSHS